MVDSLEYDALMTCLKTAAYAGSYTPRSFVAAFDKAALRQMKSPLDHSLEQFFMHTHIKRVLHILRKERSPFLVNYPEVNNLEYLGWPTYKRKDKWSR